MRSPSARIWRKAARLLRGGRVAVHAVGPHGIWATVEGDHDTYSVERLKGEWTCGCAYREYYPERPCAHIAACWLVWRAIREGNKGEEKPEPSRAPSV